MDSRNLQLFRKLRTNPRWNKLTRDFAVVAYTLFAKYEDVLHRDDVAFHTGDFGERGNFARAVAEAADLHDHVDCRGDMTPNRDIRNVEAAHRDHRLEAAQSVPRSVRVNRRERTVVARIHGLEHVQRFFATNLTDDDAVGTHTQRVDNELPLLNRAPAFDVGWTRLQSNHVVLVELQFGRILHGDDAFAIRNVRRQNVKERRLAGTRAA